MMSTYESSRRWPAALLVTNDLADNGQAELFTDGVHLVSYRQPGAPRSLPVDRHLEESEPNPFLRRPVEDEFRGVARFG